MHAHTHTRTHTHPHTHPPTDPHTNQFLALKAMWSSPAAPQWAGTAAPQAAGLRTRRGPFACEGPTMEPLGLLSWRAAFEAGWVTEGIEVGVRASSAWEANFPPKRLAPCICDARCPCREEARAHARAPLSHREAEAMVHTIAHLCQQTWRPSGPEGRAMSRGC